MRYTVLINKENKWKESYAKRRKLISYFDTEEKEIQVEKETYQAYLKLKEFLEKIGVKIGITSAYRTIEDQEEVYKELAREQGEEYVASYVALPEYSEHHTGLALDIGILMEKKYIEEENEQTKSLWKKIHNNLSKFGFIVRYPKEKDAITGYSYEPWHIRYVGLIPASIISKNNWTLEEYLKEFGGVISVNKPEGITSFDVVKEISDIFGIKKVGHTGTLDPMATGVLLVAIGKATKIVELLTAEDKEYRAGVELGYQTDTYDRTGTILETKEVPSKLPIQKTLESFRKTYLQEVPIYSAVKVNGKKLYEYARKKEEIDLPKKEVTIKEIELLEENGNAFTFKALVTKGCYIRSLIHDIGKSLNTYATMTSLERTKQGKIFIDDTYTLEEIKENHFHLHTIEEALDYPIVKIDQALERKISNGVSVKDSYHVSEKVIFQNANGKLLGIYQKKGDSLVVWKNFV